MQQKLKPDAVPTVFNWTKTKSPSQTDMIRWLKERNTRKRKAVTTLRQQMEEELNHPVDVFEVIVDSQTSANYYFVAKPVFIPYDSGTQTEQTPMFSLQYFRHNDKDVHFYPGLELYTKLRFVLSALGPAACCLSYIYHNIVNVSVEDQFFITLIKLRRYTTNYELSIMFNISEATVKNIVYTLVLFMHRQWGELDTWPYRSLVRYFLQSDLKAKVPTTFVIVDGTECPIKKPKAPRAQQSTFSTYKNQNTVKTFIGATPGGQFFLFYLR